MLTAAENDQDANAEFTYLWERRAAIQLRALSNRIYYQERQRIFEAREGWVKAASIIGGSVALAKITDPLFMQILGAVIAGASALSLVFGFGAKARDSAKRNSEWALLEKEIELRGERGFTEDDISKWAAKCNEIEAGEPSPNTWLFEASYQRACTALKQEPCSPAKLSRLHKYLPPIFIH